MIFNIQRFSTHDGPGIRTVIFYKGCPLHCDWCSNPESQAFGYSLMYDRQLCKSFGDCLKQESNYLSAGENRILVDWVSVTKPEKFKNICAARALTVSGEEKSIGEIIEEIEKDRSFFEQGDGGVTFSGGEPLSQGPELDVLLLELNKLKIGVAIETSLYVPWENIERCLGRNINFLVDLKHTDSDKFKIFTGGNADLVLSNIKKLAASNENMTIRVPVIPEFNHTFQEMKKIIDFTVALKTVREIHFLPFHNFGSAKYEMLGMDYKYSGIRNLVADELDEYVVYAESVGLIAKIGG
ncbi:MAG: glycyl-radical enzyme activating protein [Bacteroidota bacterium]|nr:glycyl-radical enzyme activating protein [Odoribacter sp.]MDP3645273.1 glycyl-radical enzyme activating protein [Bacteroidota bacterium]